MAYTQPIDFYNTVLLRRIVNRASGTTTGADK